jgi:hypothetical protein
VGRIRLVLFIAIATGSPLAPVSSLQTAGDVSAQRELVVTIDELSGSGMSGDATITDNADGTVTIDVLVEGAAGGHPIHFHTGDCSQPSDVIFPLSDIDATGGSVTDVALALDELLAQTPLAIVVHLSAEDIGAYIACGTIDGSSEGGEEFSELSPSDAPDVQGEDILYSASDGEDFVAWQADFWRHEGEILSTEPSSQTYIQAPYALPNQAVYALEAELRVPGSYGGDQPCTSYFGFIIALDNPAEGVFAGFGDLGDPQLDCASRYVTWTPWIDGTELIDGAWSDFELDNGWHAYRLEVSGSQIRLLIDGSVVFRSTDHRYTPTGGVGVVSGNLALELRSFRLLGAPPADQTAPMLEQQASATESTNTPDIQPIDPPTTVTQWGQYTNDVIGLTLNYPPDWTVVESGDRYYVLFLPPGADPEAPSEAISIFFAPMLPYRSNDELYGVSEPEPFVVSGISGRAYQDVSDDLPVQSAYVEIPWQGGTLLFSATPGSDVDVQPVFEQMLASVMIEERGAVS